MLSMYENGNNSKKQLKKRAQFKIVAQVTKQDNVRNPGTFPHSIDHPFLLCSITQKIFVFFFYVYVSV